MDPIYFEGFRLTQQQPAACGHMSYIINIYKFSSQKFWKLSLTYLFTAANIPPKKYFKKCPVMVDILNKIYFVNLI